MDRERVSKERGESVWVKQRSWKKWRVSVNRERVSKERGVSVGKARVMEEVEG